MRRACSREFRVCCVLGSLFSLQCSPGSRTVKPALRNQLHHGGRKEPAERLLPQSVDGAREGAWIVADYIDVVLHVFTPETRGYYRLEELWGDVPAIEYASATA